MTLRIKVISVYIYIVSKSSLQETVATSVLGEANNFRTVSVSKLSRTTVVVPLARSTLRRVPIMDTRKIHTAPQEHIFIQWRPWDVLLRLLTPIHSHKLVSYLQLPFKIISFTLLFYIAYDSCDNKQTIRRSHRRQTNQWRCRVGILLCTIW